MPDPPEEATPAATGENNNAVGPRAALVNNNAVIAPGAAENTHEVNISMNAPRLELFTGTSDFTEFISQFNIQAAARGWDAATKARWFTHLFTRSSVILLPG